MTRAEDSCVPSWPQLELKDLVDDRGITYGIVQPGQPQDDGVPILRVNNFRSGELQLDDVMRVAPAVAARFKRSTLRGGEVLITLVGSTGQVAVATPDLSGWNVARAVGVVPVRDRDAARWVAWCLQTPGARAFLDARLNTTVQSTLNLRDLASLSIPMPPAGERDAIASVLGTLDDKIDSNRRLGRLLEETAATLFRARFVDFVGVDEFEESEIGRIPRGWSVRPVSTLCEVKYGYTASAVAEPVGPKFLRVKDINKQPWIDWATVPFCEIDDDRAVRSRLIPGDLVVARMADPGKSAMVVDEVDAVCASYLVRLRPSSTAWSEFLHRYLRSRLYQAYVQSVMSGSVQKNINARILTEAKAATPPIADLTAFAEQVGPMHRSQACRVREARTLAELRDAVLPKLISGEIRVPDTADQAEVIDPVAEALASSS